MADTSTGNVKKRRADRSGIIIASFAVALMFIISVPFIFGGDDEQFTDSGVIGAGEVCEIVETVTEYVSLDAALSAVTDGQTIRLLSNIIHNDAVEISGKTVTIDLNGFWLFVNTTIGVGLYVSANGELILDDTSAGKTGTFSVTGKTHGVFADGGKATVTYAYGEEGYGAYAINDGAVTLQNGASGGIYGVYADNGGEITIDGFVDGQHGAYADNGGTIIVRGMVSGHNGKGAHAVDGGEIAVEGGVYGKLYGAYTEGGTITVTGSLWGEEICGAYADGGIITVTGNSVGGMYGAYADGGTISAGGDIKGTEDFSCGAYAENGGEIVTDGNAEGWEHGAYADSGEIIIGGGASGVNGYGIYAGPGSTVTVVYSTIGAEYGAYADGGTIIVGISVISEYYIGAYAENGGTITVGWSANGGYTGAYADGGTIIVEYHAWGGSNGVYAANGGSVTVKNYVDGHQYGAYAGPGGTITLNNDVFGYCGAYAAGGTITVDGTVYGTQYGVRADAGGTVTAKNNVSGYYGAYAEDGGTVDLVSGYAKGTLYGAYAGPDGTINVAYDAEAAGDHSTGAHANGGKIVVRNAISEGADGRGACAENGGTVIVTGNVTAHGDHSVGAYTRGNGEIIVTGNVTANGDHGIGAYVFNGGNITIDGEITADIFIFLWSEEIAKSDGVLVTDGAKEGYWYYGDGENEVWVNTLDVTTVTVSAIDGVTAPVAGATPVTTITETSQYTGTVTWDPSDPVFGHGTVYTATITLAPKGGYTFIGVGEDFFSVDGASCTNDEDSGVVKAMFPATAAPATITITISAINGVTVPIAGATPVTTITETSQYTGTVTWDPADPLFSHNTVYTATITLTPKAGYTLAGVPANFFTVAGTMAVGNTAGSGTVTLVFPATAPIKDVKFSAEADGSATATSTKITITFDTAVTGLTAADIIIPGTGAAAKGALTPAGDDGKVYELALTVTAAGYITAGISLIGHTFSPESIGADTTGLYLYVTHTVTYDLTAGGGTAPTESPKAAGATFSAASATGITAPEGKQFKHWNTAADGTGAGYAAGSTVTMNANALTLYAIWDAAATGGPAGDDTGGGTGNGDETAGDGGNGLNLWIVIIILAVIIVIGAAAFLLYSGKR